jgi:hypothetical protein
VPAQEDERGGDAVALLMDEPYNDFLPTPLSPVIRTFASDRAAACTSSCSARLAALRPIRHWAAGDVGSACYTAEFARPRPPPRKDEVRLWRAFAARYTEG